MSELKTIIDANIKENGNQEITGKVLNYVLNKIAEGTQKDWNESDATKGEYIKGRTHGVTYELVSVEGTLKELGYVPGEYVSVLHYARVNGVLEGKGLYLGGLLYNPIVGEEYIVKYAGPSVYAKVVEVEDGYDVQIKGASDTGNILKVAIVGYKTIDDAYISTDIARKSQVDALEQKVDNLPKGEEFDKQGNYPLLHVGTADDLAGRGESVPAEFGFRASGGKSIKDGRAYIKRIKGNSVVWNQKASFNRLVDSLGIAEIADIERGKMITLTQDYTGSNDYDIRMAYNGQLIAGHVYCVSMEAYSSKGGQVNMDYGGSLVNKGNIPINTWSLVAAIGVAASDKANFNIYPSFKSVGYLAGDTFGVRNVRVIDLTQMFGSGNEPTTIEDFNARVATLGVDLNAYNEGQVIHCNTESIKSVGDNAWDEEWRNGMYNSKTGIYAYNANYVCNLNPFRILPNEEYWVNVNTESYFFFYDEDMNVITYLSAYNPRKILTPANAAYMNFYCGSAYGTTYNNDILISLYHSGWKAQKDDQYQPYWQDTLPLPIISKYFPDGMKKAGTAHDEIRFNKASGKWEYSKGKIKSVDMGSLSYHRFNVTTKGVEWYFFVSNDLKGIAQLPQYTTVGNALSPMYNLLSAIALESREMSDKSMMLYSQGSQLYFRNDAYTDEATFKAAMAGVMLYYEAAEWEWVELDAEDQNFRDYYNVADFGTEMSQSNVPSAPFSADIIYQFNAVDMIREHEIEITELQKVIATMQAQLASLTNS